MDFLVDVIVHGFRTSIEISVINVLIANGSDIDQKKMR